MPNKKSPILSNRQKFVQIFSAIVGLENVLISENEIELAETATFKTHQKIPFIVRPANHAEVIKCMQAANDLNVKIYPISRGRNWGLGSRVPVDDGSVLLELKRLNRITKFNEKLGYITIEPGVSFQDVHDFLKSNNSELFLSVIGGPPDASVIGNIVERGDGLGPLGDRFAHVCAMQIVTPIGEVINTGYRRFSNASSTHLQKWGLGPYLDGLFTQSNLGIITEVTCWLQEKPKYFAAFVFSLHDQNQLSPAVDALQKLQKMDVIKPSSLALWNAYKFLASVGQYPWHVTQGKTPFAKEHFKLLNNRWKDAVFTGFGGLYAANSAIGRQQRKILKKILSPHVSMLNFFDEKEVGIAHFVPGLMKKAFGVSVENMQRLISLFMGVPATESLKSAYWRKKSPLPNEKLLHPDRDKCGMLWTCHALPYDGRELDIVLRGVEKIILKYDFEPNIAVIFPSERCCYIFPAIIYDRDSEGDDDKAQKAHDELMLFMYSHNHFPYRLGIQSMGAMKSENEGYTKLVNDIKNIVDPLNILAPGRYNP